MKTSIRNLRQDEPCHSAILQGEFAPCLFLMAVAFGCGHPQDSASGYQTWPKITRTCERVLLIRDAKFAPFEYRVVDVIHGTWDGPDKNLKNWLINKACAAGADAVVNVVEVVSTNEDGQKEWNIHGQAVLFDRAHPLSPAR